MCTLVLGPAAPLPLQHPDNAWRKIGKNGQRFRPLPHFWESWMKPLASRFSPVRNWPLQTGHYILGVNQWMENVFSFLRNSYFQNKWMDIKKQKQRILSMLLTLWSFWKVSPALIIVFICLGLFSIALIPTWDYIIYENKKLLFCCDSAGWK